MSKKYILVVKEEHYGYNYFPKPINNYQISNNRLDKYQLNVTKHSINTTPSILTQEEINELPYGFVQMFNLVEVEDTTKYYWRKKQEYLCSFENLEVCYLNFGMALHKMMLSNTTEIGVYKTKFTEKEAKELLGDDFEMFERVDIE